MLTNLLFWYHADSRSLVLGAFGDNVGEGALQSQLCIHPIMASRATLPLLGHNKLVHTPGPLHWLSLCFEMYTVCSNSAFKARRLSVPPRRSRL